MNRGDARDVKIQALRDRLSRLRDASPRINEGLDLDTVLQGVLDSARSLTGAGAFIILVRLRGDRERFLPSGLTAGSRRLPDTLSHVRSQGRPNLRPPVEVGPSLSFLAAPVFHLGKRVSIRSSARECVPSAEPQSGSPLALVPRAAGRAGVLADGANRHESARNRDEPDVRAQGTASDSILIVALNLPDAEGRRFVPSDNGIRALAHSDRRDVAASSILLVRRWDGKASVRGAEFRQFA